MKKYILIILNVLLVIPFLIWFERGGNVAISMIPVWLVMSIINMIFSENIKQIVLYNGCMALFAIIGIFVCGQLYFKYVSWDSMGEAVVMLEIIIGFIYIALLTLFECLIKHFRKK